MSDLDSTKYIFLAPYKYENQFIEELKRTFESLGYTVRPFDSYNHYPKAMKESKIAVINWLEDQPSYNASYMQVFLDFLRVIKKALVIKTKMKKGFWIQHNFRPHHRKYGQIEFKIIQSLFRVLNFERLVMETNASGLPITHPLYLSDMETVALKNHYDLHSSDSRLGVLFFGAIKRYKNLHSILPTWPKDIPLTIIGKAESDTYLDELRAISIDRQVPVTIEDRFIDGDELDGLLKCYEWVLVPHANNTMIASGSFYHAISYGCNIICNQSEFGKLKSSQLKFVQAIEPSELSNSFLKKTFIPKQTVLEEVLKIYGEDIRKSQWLDLLSR